MLLRSTGKVKRGLGTIRQDVNVSIEEGARIELKGVQASMTSTTSSVTRSVGRSNCWTSPRSSPSAAPPSANHRT